MESKRCPDCDETKPLEGFSPWKKSKDGRYTYCRPCSAARTRASAARNREQNLAARRERRADPEYRRRELERDRQTRAANPELNRARIRRAHLRKYGLTVEEYDELLAQQGGCCAICRTDSTPDGRRFAIDHDHSCCPRERACGSCVRGLLCGKCNTAIGLLQEDPVLFSEAVRYLTATRKPRLRVVQEEQ
jgi:hypothetical protein